MTNIIPITNIKIPQLDMYTSCREVQLLHYYEPNGGVFIAESPKVITRALDYGCKPISMLLETRTITGEAADIVARCADIPIYTADLDVLKEITGFTLTRGALCAMMRPELSSLQSVCDGARRIAVLENVVNPTNIGAIFRSAAALNIDAVLLTPGCCDPLYRRSIRVSMGNVFQVPWTYVSDTWQADLADLGFRTAAMALSDNSVSIDDPVLKSVDKLAIVLGTEGDGLAVNTIANCDFTVKIPMSHDVDSLNVAAASAVAFWELTK